MIQTITTLFTILTLSSASRLLLQQPPMYLPITTKGAATIPPVASIPPVTTIPPAATIPPVAVTSGPATIPPVAVTSGPVVVPQNPSNYVPQVNNNVAPPQIECKFSPPNPNSCSNKMTTVTDPDLNFHVTCSEFQSCMGSRINIVYSQFASQNLETFKGLWFTNEYAAANAVISFTNNRQGNKITIDKISCDKPGACFNTQFILGEMMEIEIGDFFCAPQACFGCVVKEVANGVGIPCVDFTEPI